MAVGIPLMVRVAPQVDQLLRAWSPGPKGIGDTIAALVYAELGRRQARQEIQGQTALAMQTEHDDDGA